MSANREQQRERLIAVIEKGLRGPMPPNFAPDWADWLLDNGVTVEISEPDCGHPNHGGDDHNCAPFLPPQVEVVEATPEEWARITERHPEIGLYPGGSPAERAALAEVRAEPPQPEYRPGDVAIATVRIGDAVYPNELVLRYLDGWSAPGLGYDDLLQDEVTVTSRAAVVSEEDRDELIEFVGPHDAQTIRDWWNEKLGGEA